MSESIIPYEQIDRTEWSRLVRESETGTWFQSPEAYDFFATQEEIMEPFVVGVAEDGLREGRLRGVCVGYVTKEKNPIKQFFTRRAIILGGPALAKEATEEEARELMKGVRQLFEIYDLRFKICDLGFLSPKGHDYSQANLQIYDLKAPIYIETRNFNDYSQWKEAFEKAGFSYMKHLNFHVDCWDEKKMWERLSDNRKRQVRKGLRVTDDGIRETDIIEWYGILEKLYRTKVKTPLWPMEFFLEAYRQGVGTFLLVKHEGKVIGGVMIVHDANGAVYEWYECGLNGEYKEQYPSVMATYAGMRWAYEHGCARYDMMGAGEPDVPYGVRDFKSEFGGEMVEHGRFLCVCKPWLYKIGALGVKVLRV